MVKKKKKAIKKKTSSPKKKKPIKKKQPKKKSNSKQIINVDSFIEDFDSISSPGDIFIIMSNGNFDDISQKIIKKIND